MAIPVEFWFDRESNLAGNEANPALGAAWRSVHEVSGIAADLPELSDGHRGLLDEMAFSTDQLLRPVVSRNPRCCLRARTEHRGHGPTALRC